MRTEDALKHEARQFIGHATVAEWPMLAAGLAIAGMLKEAGRPLPADPFAWATDGQMTVADAKAYDCATPDALARSADFATALRPYLRIRAQ